MVRSYGHQVLGIVLRDSGRTPEALDELRQAVRAARSVDPDREGDVRATYAGTLVLAGETRAGLRQFERALDGVTVEVAARVRMRLAGVLAVLGRRQDAVQVLRAALADVVAVENRLWEARTRVWLSYSERALGHVRVAEQEALEAERILTAVGSSYERLFAVENVADIAAAKGDLPRALRLCGELLAEHEALGRMRIDLINLYASTYLAAGLADEAVNLVNRIVPNQQMTATDAAEFHALRGNVLLAAGDPVTAREAADRARRMFRSQRRRWHELHARLQLVRARFASGDERGLAREARQVAADLHHLGDPDASQALAIAGRLSVGEERLALWGLAASYRNRPNGLVRASAHLASALSREHHHDRGGVLRACAAGLDALDEHRRLMGSSELRALATTHGRELTEVALRYAAHDPRTLLRWSERTRATALAQPPATSDAAIIPASLAALRDNGRRLAEARQAGEPTEELEKERLRLERTVRTESHTRSAADTDPQRPASAEEVVAGVGDGCLVELVDVDGAPRARGPPRPGTADGRRYDVRGRRAARTGRDAAASRRPWRPADTPTSVAGCRRPSSVTLPGSSRTGRSPSPRPRASTGSRGRCSPPSMTGRSAWCRRPANG